VSRKNDRNFKSTTLVEYCIVNDGTSLSGKVALITGGSRGIGAAVARRFASAGMRVAIGYQARSNAAASLAADITKAGGQCMTVQGDIADAEAAQRIATDTVARFGRIDILVNCAGIGPYRPLGAMDAAFIRAILDANVLGMVLITQAVLAHLTTPGGRIINFSSALAFRPIATSSVYSASKAAVVTLTHAWSKELGSRGITVNAIAPGVIETEMTTGILAERGRGHCCRDATRAHRPDRRYRRHRAFLVLRRCRLGHRAYDYC
jgi:3-oxoacyl-[acyl-carrier protein] reductase